MGERLPQPILDMFREMGFDDGYAPKLVAYYSGDGWEEDGANLHNDCIRMAECIAQLAQEHASDE